MKPLGEMGRTEKVLAWCLHMAEQLVAKGVISQGRVKLSPDFNEAELARFKPEPQEILDAFQFLCEECGFDLTEAGKAIVAHEEAIRVRH